MKEEIYSKLGWNVSSKAEHYDTYLGLKISSKAKRLGTLGRNYARKYRFTAHWDGKTLLKYRFRALTKFHFYIQ